MRVYRGSAFSPENQDDPSEQHGISQVAPGGDDFLEDDDGNDCGEQRDQPDLHRVSDRELLGREDNEPEGRPCREGKAGEEEERLPEERKEIGNEGRQGSPPGEAAVEDLAEEGHGKAGG